MKSTNTKSPSQTIIEKAVNGSRTNESMDPSDNHEVMQTIRGFRLADTFIVVVVIAISLMLFFPITIPIVNYLLSLFGMNIR